jgi:hypothetical protein
MSRVVQPDSKDLARGQHRRVQSKLVERLERSRSSAARSYGGIGDESTHYPMKPVVVPLVQVERIYVRDLQMLKDHRVAEGIDPFTSLPNDFVKRRDVQSLVADNNAPPVASINLH